MNLRNKLRNKLRNTKIQFVLFLLFVLLSESCTTSPKKEETLRKEELKDSIVVADHESEQFLRQIFLTKGLVRGTSIGDAVEDVKKREKDAPFEEVPSHIGYSVENTELETADILYFRDSSDKIIGIHIDIFLNSEESSDAMFAALKDYFKSMYGNPISEEGEWKWKLTPNGTVEVTPITKQFDYGFEIEFSRQ